MVPYVKYFFNSGFEAVVAQREAPDFARTYDKQAAPQNINTLSFFVGSVVGQVEEKWWIPLISEEVKKIAATGVRP